MRVSLLTLSLAAALLAAPVAALADTGMSADSMAKTPAETMATLICRPATDQDKIANADAMKMQHEMTATLGNQTLICKKLDYNAMMATSAKAKKMASAADADANWVQVLQTQLNILHTTL
jgi:hypothetical protein